MSTRDRLRPGTRVGDYKVVAQVRGEETGVVYASVHLVLPRRAAVKVGHVGGRELAVKLLREACILEALSHPGVPRVFECGVLPDKRPWVALELVHGAALADAMKDGPIAIADLVVAMRAVAEILEHAHARGVVHHRIDEAVVLRTPDRAFPLCLTGWGEVSAGRDVDPSCDVHALGALAFRALTGSLLEPTASAQVQCPSAPAELTSLIDAMLAPDAPARPSAAEIHARAAWIAETLELAPPAKTRWTPPHGEVAQPPAPSVDFQVRIKS
ncbi:MAG TPA: hypothetical protein VMJ10_04995 [Kofleriaceae bacterium]|nr:hypothetical protein [Kofleriaceae bacterium]